MRIVCPKSKVLSAMVTSRPFGANWAGIGSIAEAIEAASSESSSKGRITGIAAELVAHLDFLCRIYEDKRR